MNSDFSSSEENPWKTESSREIYTNPWVRLVENQVVQPDGKPGIYGVVHFVHTATGALPIDDEGNTYLVGQYRYPLDRYEWEIPEGGCPPGEDPLACAQRELMEEAGIEAAHWEPLVEGVQLSNSVSDEVGFIYVARGLSFHTPNPEGCEQLQLRKIPLSEAIELAMSGEIHDSISLLALLKARALGLG